MKKFKFALKPVKEYKEKLLDTLKLELAAIVVQVAKQENLIHEMEENVKQVNNELNEKNSKGITPHELTNYQRYIKVQQNEIRKEYTKLEKLKNDEDEKKYELTEMKKETMSLEKLEEKKVKEYNDMAHKMQEMFVEEFVVSRKYAGR